MKEDVIKFEKIFNTSESILRDLHSVLDKLENNQKDYCALKEYYGSPEYKKDVDISDHTSEYQEIACGILSEDAVYNLIMDSYGAYIRMLEVTTRLFKEH